MGQIHIEGIGSVWPLAEAPLPIGRTRRFQKAKKGLLPNYEVGNRRFISDKQIRDYLANCEIGQKDGRGKKKPR